MTPTSEQNDIISLIKESNDNVIINALAGTGKTSTLELIQDASPVKPVLCLAFNKRIAEEMAKRFPSTTSVRTFNSLGHRIWSSAVGKVVLDTKKTTNLLREELNSRTKSEREELYESYWEIVSAIGLAKSLGYVPDGYFPHAKRLISPEHFHASLDEKPSETVKEVIDNVLVASIKAAYAGGIDFNDQIYMPALFGGTFPRFPLVLVDEAQDLSPTNHAMLDKLAKDRIVVVGDPWQSIYGFRGAHTSGMQSLKERFNMQSRDLSISFRCPEHIVKAVHWRVPHFKWVKDGGSYNQLSSLSADDIPDDAAIICRNNAPLFRMAFQLLSHKRSVSVTGSEIGPKITKILKKLGPDDMGRDELIVRVGEWLEEKLQHAQNGQANIKDMAQCMCVFAGFGKNLGEAIAYAESIFKQEGTIQLLTGHKAKGLEWDTVYHLDPWLINGHDQDLNLRYVITTRARQTLNEIDYRNIQWA